MNESINRIARAMLHVCKNHPAAVVGGLGLLPTTTQACVCLLRVLLMNAGSEQASRADRLAFP
jgi:hypothetical protein